MWFSSHKTLVVGQLDPRTGIVKEYTIPLTPGAMPGLTRSRWTRTTPSGFRKIGGHNLNKLDPKTGMVRKRTSKTPFRECPRVREFRNDA